MLGLPYPEEFGGGGQPYEVYLQVIEELAAPVGGRRGGHQRAYAGLFSGGHLWERLAAGAVVASDAGGGARRRVQPVGAAGRVRRGCADLQGL